ncbi:MAG: hypothetical protein IJ733_05970, partial [Lachnospiraceae bacterium]|nr:hypothetical protein [Lachnospiraceae bacterium]
MNISNNLAGVRSDFSLYGIRENDKEVSVQNKAEELQKADCNVANKTMVQDYSKKSILMEYEKQKQESVF